ncbi:MAG: LCP family protein [Actinomycetes bacterium]|jgi:LCP family protein required for cell wall assembly
MRGKPSKIAAGFSIAIVLAAMGFAFFTNTATSAIPRSKALQGAKQSVHGDTNILLLGLDSRRDANGADLPRALLDLMHVGSTSSVGGYNTNTMIVIHIPANGSAATAISIPRDDYVNVPGLGMKKIKEAYGYAKYAEDMKLYKAGVKEPQREHLAREAGRTATIGAITALLNIPIDHFAEVNLVGFYDLATALGGIQVCLNHAVNDSQYSGAVFPAGLQTIYGVDALKFVRQRHGLPNGDLDRTHRQQAFITGVITKFRSQGIFGDLGKLQALLNVAKKDVVIDSGWDVLGFLPQAKALTGGHITFHTLPIEGYVMRNSQSVNLIDVEKVRKFTQDIFFPPKPTPKPTATGTSSTAPKPKPSKINYANLANGKAVDGGTIPCVN